MLKYNVVHEDSGTLLDFDGQVEFSLPAAAEYAVYMLRTTLVRVVPTQRYCRWCNDTHSYTQDGCAKWPSLLPPVIGVDTESTQTALVVHRNA